MEHLPSGNDATFPRRLNLSYGVYPFKARPKSSSPRDNEFVTYLDVVFSISVLLILVGPSDILLQYEHQERTQNVHSNPQCITSLVGIITNYLLF